MIVADTLLHLGLTLLYFGLGILICYVATRFAAWVHSEKEEDEDEPI